MKVFFISTYFYDTNIYHCRLCLRSIVLTSKLALLFPPACNLAIDVGFVLDASGRVGHNNFRRIKKFVELVSRSFSISRSRARVGVIVYGSSARMQFGLNWYTNPRRLNRAIRRMRYTRGSRRTGKALQLAVGALFRRSRRKRVLITVMSGPSYDSVKIPSLQIHRAGIEVFAVGVTTQVRNQELRAIATDSRHIYMVNFSSLYGIVKSIVRKACRGIFKISLFFSLQKYYYNQTFLLCENIETILRVLTAFYYLSSSNNYAADHTTIYPVSIKKTK